MRDAVFVESDCAVYVEGDPAFIHGGEDTMDRILNLVQMAPLAYKYWQISKMKRYG